MLLKILNELQATSTTLVAVSKTKPVAQILELYAQGQRHFGENKVQEVVEKYEALPKDIHWHLIGHLQSNKVKYVASFVHLIHSVDSLKLLEAIDKQAAKNQRVVNCLLQFKIAAEDTKYGLTWEEAVSMLKSETYSTFHHVNICGVMGMATNTADEVTIRSEFRNLRGYFDALKRDFFAQQSDFKEISMGMSGDYLLAIEEGSTMVRIGSLLFGERA
ncbi:MAG: YggS family pyridoxal phosphate-dependent enzyme [Saprospiraceae bacterium]|nr:YggS family pyridoxal phosphate-dependent enzyme [Saprospiraceae bacterium]